MAYSVQMLEGLLVEAERWSEAFEFLRGNPAACARVMDAYVAWLLAQHRPLDAYRALRCTSSAYQMQMSCPSLCDCLWESMRKMAVNKDVHTWHDRRRQQIRIIMRALSAPQKDAAHVTSMYRCRADVLRI